LVAAASEGVVDVSADVLDLVFLADFAVEVSDDEVELWEEASSDFLDFFDFLVEEGDD